MHSIWQERIDFPEYPILRRDQKADIVYVGATLEHAVEAHFQQERGKAVMILEKKIISRMPELGGMGILRARNREEEKNLYRIRDYIEGRKIPCDMEVISRNCIWVHPIKLFLFLTEDVPIYEMTAVCSRKGKRLDIGCAYVDGAKIIEEPDEKEPLYVHVFQESDFLQQDLRQFREIRTYKGMWLAGSCSREIKGSLYYWEIES